MASAKYTYKYERETKNVVNSNMMLPNLNTHLKFACFIFSLSFFTQSNGGDPCPNEADLLPCTCTQELMGTAMPEIQQLPTTKASRSGAKDAPNVTIPQFSNRTSFFTTVECIAPPSLYILDGKLSTVLFRRWVDKLIVSNVPPETGNTLTRLPDDWLNNVRIRLLEIKNTQLVENFMWYVNQPLRFQRGTLHWLTVNNCSLSGALTYDTVGTVQTQGLNYLNRLQGVDLSSNHLTEVKVTAFEEPPPMLTTIILSRNNIEHLEPYAFAHVELLKHLDLSHNLLASVQRDIFPAPARMLKKIDLSWNYIQWLSPEFFFHMHALKSVNLSYNFLSTLKSAWSVVWQQLSFIDVSGNFIECDCELLWLLPVLQRRSSVTSPRNPGQSLKGQCSTPLQQLNLKTISYELRSLTRDKLICFSTEYGSGDYEYSGFGTPDMLRFSSGK